MDIIGFIREQVNRWNIEEKCGFPCFEYDAPLLESGANKSQIKPEVNENTGEDFCCVKVMVTALSIRKNRTYVSTSGSPTSFSIDYTFTMNILFPDIMDRQVYYENEHPIDEGKWDKFLKRIQDCVSGEEDSFEFCDIIGRKISILAENWVVKINYLDANYTGWAITFVWRDEVPEDDTLLIMTKIVVTGNENWNGVLSFDNGFNDVVNVTVIDGVGYIEIPSTYSHSFTVTRLSGDTGTVQGNPHVMNGGVVEIEVLETGTLNLLYDDISVSQTGTVKITNDVMGTEIVVSFINDTGEFFYANTNGEFWTASGLTDVPDWRIITGDQPMKMTENVLDLNLTKIVI